MYIDGFVVPVRADSKEAYVASSTAFARAVLANGATRVVETWSDDVPEGDLTSFPLAVKLEPGEIACFSWIEYPDKATRTACMKAVMDDPSLGADSMGDYVGSKRIIYGGFSSVLDLT